MYIRTFILTLILFSIVISPVQAATIPDALEGVNITFANGSTLTGEMEWQYDIFGINGYSAPGEGPSGLFLNGQKLFALNGEPDFSSINGVFWTPSIPFSSPTSADIYANLADLPNNLIVSDFFLDGTRFVFTDGIPGVSGTVTCISGCGVSNTPLPSTILLFASGLLLLIGFAWLRWKKILI